MRSAGVLTKVVRAGAVSALAAAHVVAGCSVGPTFTKPEATISQSWHGAGDAQISTQSTTDSLWWKAFNDPALDRLVDVAYRQNLNLQVAALRITEARAQLGVATGRQFPQTQVVTGSAKGIGLSRNVPDVPMLPRNFGIYEMGFDAAWEVDFWGKYRRAVESEQANLMASVADYHAAHISVTAEVARTYVVIRTFEVLIAQAKSNARLQEEAQKIAESRFKNGATSELDPTQATTLLESTRATIPRLGVDLQRARNSLSTLLGQPSGTIDALLAGPQEIPKAPAKVAVGVPAEMLRRRPDIRSAELLAAAQCARIGVAKAELYPSFTLFGTVGVRALSTEVPKNLFSSKSIFYRVGPEMSWPFFNYGRLTNAVRIEEARFQQLLVSYRDTVLRAAQEVEDAMTGFVNNRLAETSERAAVASAARAVELSVVAYREGATDFQRVLDAQRSLLQQQNTLAQTGSSVVTNLIALYKALGGGWEAQAQAQSERKP